MRGEMGGGMGPWGRSARGGGQVAEVLSAGRGEVGFWSAEKGGTASATHPLLPTTGTLGAALSPSRPPGRAGRRKRFSCGRHRCPAQRPKMEPDPAWPADTASPLPPGPRSRRWEVQRVAGALRGVEGRGGGGRAHLGPPPAPPRASGSAPVPVPVPAPSPRPLPHSPALSPSRSLSSRPALRRPLPHGPSPCPSSSWLRPSLVSGFRPCP